MTGIFLTIFLLIGPGLHSKPLVVTSFTILKDWVQVLAQDHVDVVTIVGPNQDAHVFEPTPDTLKTLMKADLVLTYGFGFETWFERIRQAISPLKRHISIAQGLKPLHIWDESLGRPMMDPHGWHDLTYAQDHCIKIAEALKALAPFASSEIQKNLDNYLQALKNLDQDIKQKFKHLHQNQKILITSHDGFGYFARAYGVRVLALQGLSTESQPSAKMMVTLIELIKKTGVTTLFLENITNPTLLQQVSQETKATLKGPIYSDALSEPQEPAATFLDLMHYNVGLFYDSMIQIPKS